MWSPDSSKIYFTTTQVDDPSYEHPHADVYSVAASGGAPAKDAHHQYGAARNVAQSGRQAPGFLRFQSTSRCSLTPSRISG